MVGRDQVALRPFPAIGAGRVANAGNAAGVAYSGPLSS